MPFPIIFSVSKSAPPAITTTGILCKEATSLIPSTTLPFDVCESIFPSPVNITSTSSNFSSNFNASRRTLIPFSSVPFRNVMSAYPIPPAAPDPGCFE